MEQTKTKNDYQVSIRGLDMVLQDLSSSVVITNKISNLSDWLHSLGFTDIQIGMIITSQDDLALELSLTTEQYSSFVSAECNLTIFPFQCIQKYMNELDKQEYLVDYDLQLISDINAMDCVVVCEM